MQTTPVDPTTCLKENSATGQVPPAGEKNALLYKDTVVFLDMFRVNSSSAILSSLCIYYSLFSNAEEEKSLSISV